jgi:transglutaminase-like putative cysteine protease
VKGDLDEKASSVRAEIVVAEDDATLPPIFRSDEYQAVTRSGGTYALELKSMGCDAACDGHSLPLSVPADVAPFLLPTATSQSDDAAIVERARTIASGRTDARTVAEAIVRWSYETLEKKDGVRGAATAVETLAQNGGDCTEHTALTVALLRAAGLPARNTAGIVLVPGFFSTDAGYHAWVEVWLGEWVAMDPALGRLTPGPHYVRLGHEEPGMDDGSSALGRLLGRTTITLR